MPPRRRTSDALRAVDGLVHSHLQQAPVDVRILMNLAVAMATEFSNAARGTLLLDDGAGLVPRFAIGPGLQSAAADDDSFDATVVAQIANGGSYHDARKVAVPVMLGGRVRGVLYLEAGLSTFEADIMEFATAVAGRLATLLHSARLVADAAHREKSVETLEALSECLSAGAVLDEDLERAIDAVLHATHSEEAVLALLDDRGEPLDLHIRGKDRGALQELTVALATCIEAGDRVTISELVGEPHLLEPLCPELLGPQERARGLLMVRRRGGKPYLDSERSFFRALANLLSGALARLAYFRRAAEDPLTRTGSRLALELAFAQAVDRARLDHRPLAILLIDVDRFKDINDTHGHATGDEVLGLVANTLRSRLRATDFVARYGGDEFLLLLPDTDGSAAAELAEELRRLVADRPLGIRALATSLSIGLAMYPEDGKTPVELLEASDRALYKSKRGGRNRVSTASHGILPRVGD